MSGPMDLHRGRKPVSEVWTQQGWHYRSEWLLVLPTWFPVRTKLVARVNARDGTVTLAIDGMNEDDGA
jgi:hypothetical protein